MVKLIIHNYYDSDVPSKVILENIDNETKISHLKLLINLKIDNTENVPSTEINLEKVCEMYILYFGNTLLNDDEEINAYNHSNLSEIILFLYKKNILKVVVKIIKSINCCGIIFTPCISLLRATKIQLNIVDQAPITELKGHVLEHLADYKNKHGLQLSHSDIKLIYNGRQVDENIYCLSELRCKRVLHLKLYIPFEYDKKLSMANIECANSDESSVHKTMTNNE